MNPAELFRHETDALKLPPGDTLFREGEKGEKTYVVLEGEMDFLLGNFVLETVGPGALIGEMALIDDSPRTATQQQRPPAGWRKSIDVGSIFSFSRRRISQRT
jgi:CRP-like cAMP-binding protein